MSSRFLACLLLLAPAYAETNRTIVILAPHLDDLDLMAVDVAADVTVIERTTIEQSGAASIPELLQSEANVLMRGTTGNGNDGQISMRGFGENSHLRTLVLVDGHKANRPDMGGIEWQSIPVSSIEKVEVIRGGQNVLYGNHALSGVVKITTKRGDDAGLQINGTMGSFGYRSGAINYGESVGDIDLGVGVSSYGYDGYRSNSASRATSFSASASWFMNDTDTLTLRASGGESHIQFPGPLLYEQMQADPTQSSYTNNYFSEMISGQSTAIWETERDWGAARVASGLNLRDMDWELDGIVANNRQEGMSLGPRIKWGGEDNFFIGGVDTFYDKLKFTSYVPTDTRYVTARADLDRLKWSPYFFVQRKTEKELTFGSGARYEQARTDNHYEDYVDNQILPYRKTNRGTEPNPDYKSSPDLVESNSFDGVVVKDGWAGTLSLTQDFSKSGSGWLRYDRVYRYPTLDETASYQGFPLSDPLNENLDPEHGNNFEVGSRYGGEEWTVALTGFYLTLDNEIAYDNAEKLNRNIGSTRRVGAETELAWSREWYGASTRWTFVDARFEDGENKNNRVPLVPWAYGTTSAWIEPVPEFRLTATYIWVSGQYQGDDKANMKRKMDAYGLFGFRANIVMSEYVGLVISIHNLFDKTYATTAHSGSYYPSMGRNFRFGLTLEY